MVYRIQFNRLFIRIAPVCLAGLLAGCADPKRTIVHREWSEHATRLKGVSLLVGDSLSPAYEDTIRTTLAGRDLAFLADSSEDWNLDTAGIRISVPFQGASLPFDFQIRSHQAPAAGDTLRSTDAIDPEADRPEVVIHRLDRSGSAPILIRVMPESLSLVLAGIPFDSAFAPALPAHSRIMARKAARFRVEFDGRVLEGEAHIVEYRYASTTIDIENEGL